MILELVGLPGAGKSTFAKSLADKGGWQIVRTHGPLDILMWNSIFLLRHPIYFFYGLGMLMWYRGDPSQWYSKFINLFLVHNAKYMKASCLKRAIIDQGHFQNILSLFDTEVSREVIARYSTHLPPPDVMLFFDVDKETRLARQEKRGYGVRENVSPEIREVWLGAGEFHFSFIHALALQLPFTTKTLTQHTEASVLASISSMHLWRFVMHLRMPTEKAHGLQIGNTLNALAGAGQWVELWVPKRTNAIEGDIFSYYGLHERFPVRYFSVPEVLLLSKYIGRLAFGIDAFFFLIALLISRTDTESIYYTRSPEVAWLLKQKGARVYYEAHMWVNSKEELFRFFLREVDGVVANSEGTKSVFEKNGFLNTTVVRNGASLGNFKTGMTKEDARKSLGLPMEKTLIMYVGSFARWKGVATLYRAWANIRAQFPNAVLVLVGGEVGELTRFEECRDVGRDAQTLVLPHQRASLIPTYLTSADFLVLPNEPISEESIRFTSPIKLFEYMASGRPIVVSDMPSMREVLDDSSATFFKAGDHRHFTEVLTAILTNPSEANARAKEAERIVQAYSWEKRAERLMVLTAKLKFNLEVQQ